MKLISFHETDSGGSRFAEVQIDFPESRQDEFGHTLRLSNAYASPNVQFVQLPAAMDQDWHNAPARQLVVVLNGQVEVETSDGECRRWGAGEAFIPADVAGQGHRTRTIDGPAQLLFAPLPDNFAIDDWRSS